MGTGSVVVGVDGSEGSSAALSWSIETARRLGSPVSAVFGYSPWAGMLFAIPPFDADATRELLRSRFQDDWCAPLTEADVEHARRFVSDDPARALLQVADEEDAVLITVGAHGHSGWSPHVLGGVTAKVLHHAHCPVAVVPHPPVEEPPSGRIVVGIDGSPGSRRALRWAAAHARDLDKKVRAVCVIPHVLWHEQPAFPTADGKGDAELESGLGHLAREIEAETGATVTTDVVRGDPAETLLALSPEWDLLVLGSRGHSSVGEVVFGSVGRVCATRATRPVLIVPHTGTR